MKNKLNVEYFGGNKLIGTWNEEKQTFKFKNKHTAKKILKWYKGRYDANTGLYLVVSKKTVDGNYHAYTNACQIEKPNRSILKLKNIK